MSGGGCTIASSVIRVRTHQRRRHDSDGAQRERDEGGQSRGHDRKDRWLRYPPDLMTWRRRAHGGLAALVTIALVAGCDATVPSSSPAAPSPVTTASSPTTGPSASPSAAAVAVPPAHWSDCGNGFQCADIRVPSDYGNTSAGYLNVSLLRLPATEPKDRIGSLLVNPGGPGGSGVEFVRAAGESGQFPTGLRKRFDIIGFDPRGVNASTEIRCIDNLDPQALLDPSPDDATELEELVDAARDYAGECAKRNDTTLPYLSTDAVVQDLDVIRQAVGDEKLTYLGFSYGTLIGSLYADRYPGPGPGDGPRWGDGPVDGTRAVPRRTGGGLREGTDQLPRRLRRADGLRLPRGRQAGGGVRCADGIDRREAAPGDDRTRSSIGRAGDRRIRRPCGSVLTRNRGRSWRARSPWPSAVTAR